MLLRYPKLLRIFFHHIIFHFQTTRLFLNIKIFFSPKTKKFSGSEFQNKFNKSLKKKYFPALLFPSLFPPFTPNYCAAQESN